MYSLVHMTISTTVALATLAITLATLAVSQAAPAVSDSLVTISAPQTAPAMTTSQSATPIRTDSPTQQVLSQRATLTKTPGLATPAQTNTQAALAMNASQDQQFLPKIAAPTKTPWEVTPTKTNTQATLAKTAFPANSASQTTTNTSVTVDTRPSTSKSSLYLFGEIFKRSRQRSNDPSDRSPSLVILIRDNWPFLSVHSSQESQTKLSRTHSSLNRPRNQHQPTAPRPPPVVHSK